MAEYDDMQNLNSKLTNENIKMKEEYQNYVKSSTDTHSRLNMRLQHCYGKMNILNKEKNSEINNSKSDLEIYDSKVKTYEEAIEKNKQNSKKIRENSLIKGNKLTENLQLIDEKIKTIIENLPTLQNEENNSKIKKQISQVRSNLLHIERNLNKNKFAAQRNSNNKDLKDEESNKIILTFRSIDKQ